MAKKKPESGPMLDMDAIGHEMDELGDALVARCGPQTGIIIIVTSADGEGVHSSNLSPSLAADVMRSIASQIDRPSSVRTRNLRHN